MRLLNQLGFGQAFFGYIENVNELRGMKVLTGACMKPDRKPQKQVVPVKSQLVRVSSEEMSQLRNKEYKLLLP